MPGAGGRIKSALSARSRVSRPPAPASGPEFFMATFFFRAVASDGKVRSGSLTGDNEKVIARELRKQGLTPIYVGIGPKGSALEIKLPSFGKGRRRDVLFFTQELSTLLNAGVPLDRSLTITCEITERPTLRFI